MIFLWTTTKHGKIWLDGDEFRRIITDRLPAGFTCQEISFVGDQNLLNAYVTLPEDDDPQKRLAIVDKFEAFFRRTGIAIRIHWTRQSVSEARSARQIWHKPPFWAAVCGGVVGLANLGLSGVLWVAVAAAVGFGVSWLALSDDGRNMLRRLTGRMKDGGR